MARKGIGAAMNRVLNFVGLVDADEEPQRSNNNRYSLDDDFDSARQSGYTPLARRNDQPQRSSSSRSQGSSRTSSSYGYNSSYGSSFASRSNASRSSSRQQPRDQYEEWNTAPRSQNRYANSIYDDDTTLRGNVSSSYDNDFGYDDRSSRRSVTDFDDRDSRRSYDDGFGYDDRDIRRTSRSTRSEETEDRRPVPVEPRNARSRSGEVVVFDLRSLEDCREVIQALIANKTVIFSLEELDKPLMRRVVDTLSGAACALDATIRRTSDVSYLIAPSSIEVNGTRRTVERRY